MPEPNNTYRVLIIGFIAMIVIFGASDIFQKDLEPVVGYVGSVAASIVISAIIAFVVCLFGKLEKSKALAIYALLPPTVVTFEQVRTHSIDMTGNGLLSLLLAIASALAVGLILALIVKKVTGVNWDVSAGSPVVESKTGPDA
jgi:hypothetical protein